MAVVGSIGNEAVAARLPGVADASPTSVALLVMAAGAHDDNAHAAARASMAPRRATRARAGGAEGANGPSNETNARASIEPCYART